MPVILFFLFIVGVSVQTLGTVVSPLGNDELFVCNAGLGHPHSYSAPVYGSNTLLYQGVNSDGFWNELSSVAGDQVRALVLNPVQQFSWQLQATKFDFSTEKYGASYFIDLCYRGPIANLQRPGQGQGPPPGGPGQGGGPPAVDISEGLYRLDLELSAFQPGANTYTQESGLFVETNVLCDLRQAGSQRAARGLTELVPGSWEVDAQYSSGGFSFANGRLSLNIPLNNTNRTVPRFCIVRVLFEETQAERPRNFSLGFKETEIFIDVNRD